MVTHARAGFSLVEVIVAFTLLTVAMLGLAAVTTLSTTSLRASLVQERAVRHAAALLDSLTFAPGGGTGSVEVDGVTYTWDAPAAPGTRIRLTTTAPGPPPFTLELTARRIGVAPAVAP